MNIPETKEMDFGDMDEQITRWESAGMPVEFMTQVRRMRDAMESSVKEKDPVLRKQYVEQVAEAHHAINTLYIEQELRAGRLPSQ